MPLTNAERQQAYRERHLGRHGEKARIQLFLSAHARAQLDRLARHKDYTVTALIEEWAASAERRATSRLSGRTLKRYYDGEQVQPPHRRGLVTMSEHRIKSFWFPFFSMWLGGPVDVKTVDDWLAMLEATVQSRKWKQLRTKSVYASWADCLT